MDIAAILTAASLLVAAMAAAFVTVRNALKRIELDVNSGAKRMADELLALRIAYAKLANGGAHVAAEAAQSASDKLEQKGDQLAGEEPCP